MHRAQFWQQGVQPARGFDANPGGGVPKQPGSSFVNQKCSLPVLLKRQAILEKPTSWGSQPNQVCDLNVEPGEWVRTSKEWRMALKGAEVKVVTGLQFLVQSPILTKFADAACSLRQKPLGWSCNACKTWVFEQVNGRELISGLLVEPAPSQSPLGEGQKSNREAEYRWCARQPQCLSGPK